MQVPSIFNDVFGPVMRGPSSSHCAASLRIGRLCRDLMSGDIQRVRVEFDPEGSLATTHYSQGSDMGLLGGLLGWDADDDRLPDYLQAIEAVGIQVEIEITDIGATHPNTYCITLSNSRDSHQIVALSLGGGMVELIAIDGAPVSIDGGSHELLVYAKQDGAVKSALTQHWPAAEVVFKCGDRSFYQVTTQGKPTIQQLDALMAVAGVEVVIPLAPVLPVMSGSHSNVPFTNCESMLAYNRKHSLPLWQLAVAYEVERGGLSQDQVWLKMHRIVDIMQASTEQGLQGTEYADRILPCQSSAFKEQMAQGRLLEGDLLNQIILHVTAMMEVKSAMGVIVAAPTAGSCGTVPGAILGAAKVLNATLEQIVEAMFAAAIIGLFIAKDATFAAETGGCQAECGSAAGMAAAGLVHLAGGNLQQSLTAASLALQNSFGMVCDPIANRVEAPCLGKNIMAASNALSCANMALAGFDPLIPLDEVITAMHAVGKSIHADLRCTGKGGLAVTPSARAIEQSLAEQGVSASLANGKWFKSC